MTRPFLTQAEQMRALRLLSTGMNDAETAKAIKCSAQSIGRLRRKHGIDPAPPKRFEPTHEQLAELHSTSDREMQRKHGVNVGTWHKVRQRYNVPAYRPPTRIGGVPNKWAVSVPKQPKSEFIWMTQERIFRDPKRDHSVAGEAAAHLQRERFVVFNREKVYGDKGWQVGRMVLDEAEMIQMAERKGFVRQEWMGA